MTTTPVGRRIKWLRDQRGWSAQDLAVKAGLWPMRVYEWESGRCEPSSQSLQSLAAAFGVSVDYLLGGKRESTTDQAPES